LRVAHGDVETPGAFGLVVALLAVAAVVLSVSSAPAGAVVAKIGGHAYGLTPIKGANAAPLPAVKRALRASGVSATGPIPYDKAGQLVSHGGPVMHSVTTHVIYWDPSGEFTPTTKAVVHKFFTDVAHDSGLAGNVFGIAGQYGDSSGGHALYNSTSGTEETDSTTYGPDGCTIPKELGIDESPFYEHCVTDAKLQSELSAYIAAHPPLPTGPTQQYFVLLPHNVVTCLPEEEVKPGVFIHPCSNNFYCAYHSVINGGTPSETIYSDIPFSLLDSEFVKGCQSDGNEEVQLPNGDATGGDETTKFADVALKYMSHEYIEAATDPLGNAWWENSHGQEIGDKCNFAGSGPVPGEDPNAFMPTLGGDAELGTLVNQSIDGDGFYLQSEWDNTGIACLMKPMPLSAAGFTAPSSGAAGSAVSFTGSATDPYAGLAFAWSFGDGATGTGSSPSHTYSAAGTYTVTMTPKDALTGSTALPVQHNIVVAAPPTPPPAATPVSLPVATTAVVVPNGSFSALKAVLNAKTGAITFTGSVSDPGTFSWLLTFQNGKFGVFAASTAKCKTGFVRLAGRCRPSRIVFAKGSKLVASAGAFSFTIRPSASALKALKKALKQRKGIPVAATFTFKSSRGGGAVSHAQSLTVKLKK
jgi:PKD repeat protein